MLNNILNGWRPLITKLAIAIVLLYVLVKCIPVLASSLAVENKWTCGLSKEVGEVLSSSGEEIIATGSADDMFIMSFWANKETREWTLVVTDNKKSEISCVVLYGTKLKTISVSKISV